jgi:heme ABC exporter ATP-binding subunit CcmA
MDGAVMAPAIRLRSAVALLGRFPALAGVDLDVAAGETVLVQGPNGAGKTSLLRACAGLLPVVAGDIDVLGHDLRRDRRSVRRRVGFLWPLYDDLTVADNIRFAVRASRGDQARVAPALHRLGLSERLHDVVVSRLSTGQRRRAALAAVVARNPELWLLDEPHAGLDLEARGVLDSILADAAARGSTVVVASHDEAPADRVVHLDGGVVRPAPEPVHVA